MTEKNNKLIAEFMGHKNGNIFITTKTSMGVEKVMYPPSSHQYHTQWNWLIPVINKCYRLHCIDDMYVSAFIIENNIDEAYAAVIESIELHNR